VATTLSLLKVQGPQIVDAAGRPVVLQGVAFGNQVWSDARIPRQHHDERDFERVRAMGMNSIRFYLNYKSFESDDRPGVYLKDGFDWLDENVDWARKHGVYLVLNMHVPQGGYQSLGKGKALWSDAKEQDRFIQLWRAIAERYKGEPAVAGFDILNEPVVSESLDQWKQLAERTIAAIREVNQEHIVFVERLNAIDGDWKENADRNFFRVGDPNVVYEFHFYKPFHFTHQSAPWVSFAAADQRYPDEKVAEVEWFLLEQKTGTFKSPTLPAGDSEWRYYEGEAFTVKDPKLVVGKPTLACDKVGQGEAMFDDLVLERLEGKKVVEKVWTDGLETERGWYYWTADGSGGAKAGPSGRALGKGLVITGSQAEANLGADYRRFVPKQRATYRLSGWMRGKQIPEGARCQIRLDFFESQVPVTRRNKDFLKAELDAYVAWGRREQVPLYLGEWGAIKFAFADDRGGVRWAADLLDLILERDLSFAYHDYHEEFMGIYLGDGELPREDRRHEALVRLFTERLGNQPKPQESAPAPAAAPTAKAPAAAPAPVPAAPAPVPAAPAGK
jgi:endoglucanase